MTVAVPRDALLSDLLVRLHRRLPELDLDVVRTGVAITEFAASALAALETHFARYDLSQARFSALLLLYHYPERAWTPGLLADALRVRAPTMTGIVQVLEQQRWVRRRHDPADRRKTLLQLSGAGKRRFARLLPRHFVRIAAAFAGIRRKRRTAFREAIHGMHQVMDSLAAGGPPPAGGAGRRAR